jgi:hypothetical protein
LLPSCWQGGRDHLIHAKNELDKPTSHFDHNHVFVWFQASGDKNSPPSRLEPAKIWVVQATCHLLFYFKNITT